jgi:hypothetical protein
MFGVVALLCVVGDKNAGKILSLYGPALNWIARWLPLFYVPALVTLPLALNGIPGGDLVRIVGILLVGMVATLLFTAQVGVGRAGFGALVRAPRSAAAAARRPHRGSPWQLPTEQRLLRPAAHAARACLRVAHPGALRAGSGNPHLTNAPRLNPHTEPRDSTR